MSAPDRGSWRKRLVTPAIVVVSVLVALGAAEVALRLSPDPPRRPAFPPVPCGDCAYLFEANKKEPNVSPQGFRGVRDRDFAKVPPEGVFRIAVVGDSLPYGFQVEAAEAFPNVLERELDGRFGRVEVINASVPAFTPYNERNYWLHKVKDFHPHLVIVSFCMNDVVDPLLHWFSIVAGNFREEMVPQGAIPNPAYHRDHALPKARRDAADARSLTTRLLRKSEIYKKIIAPFTVPGVPDSTVKAGGKTYPSYLSGEDTLGLDVLMDYESPEWRWLRGQYDGMLAEMKADGASVMVIVNPIAYQIPADYPLLPQKLFDRYCKERAIRCLDVLPALRAYDGKEDLFYGTRAKVLDVWHYTATGHKVAADALAQYLEREGLLPPPKTSP